MYLAAPPSASHDYHDSCFGSMEIPHDFSEWELLLFRQDMLQRYNITPQKLDSLLAAQQNNIVKVKWMLHFRLVTGVDDHWAHLHYDVFKGRNVAECLEVWKRSSLPVVPSSLAHVRTFDGPNFIDLTLEDDK